MPGLILIWIWLCTFLTCAGWGLSALHELNAGGYLVALVLAAAGFILCRKAAGPIFPDSRKIYRRFRHAFPLAFLILAGMALLGGLLYEPNNYDALTYRLPRILHWLAADRWHWIHSMFPRVNGRACGIEWVSAPIIALLKTERPLFLINFISFLLLPGLIFSVFTRLGVRPRVAWHWMWLAPTGYGFLLQAGSIGNDLFGVPFVLAAIDLALRAQVSRRRRDLFASILAAALMTGVKTSNLPLLLPWAIAILPALGCVRRWLAPGLAVGLVALTISALPTLIFNARYYHGDWSGLSAEGDNKKGNVPLRTASNTALLAVQNLVPPVFPMADAWNRFVLTHMPASLSLRLHDVVVEPEAAEFTLYVMQIEENAGLGFGLTVLLLLSVAAAVRLRGRHDFRLRKNSPATLWREGVRWSPLISLLALLSQSEVAPISRILLPYYLVLLPIFLAGKAQVIVVSRRWWRAAAGAVFLLAAVALVITPARPLFPALTLLSPLQTRHPESAALKRAVTVYSIYRDRDEAFAPALAELPPGEKVLGLYTYDDPETSLWKPFGTRRVEHVCQEDTTADLQRRGIRYILIPPDKLAPMFRVTPEHWVQSLNAQIVKKIPLHLRAAEGFVEWWLIKLP